ncbi:hypothetical protein [Nocardioides aequoreus]|uniref:hypothetical protein n=1 Tax=Nocardioides aequoreus TaxID=397278 RepID=UPI0012F69767|nr:hypothetical protein [Nocardioides aequoreus]
MLHERAVMLEAVNDLRAAVGLPPTTMRVIYDAEVAACGHVDYVATFAIGCARAAMDTSAASPAANG